MGRGEWGLGYGLMLAFEGSGGEDGGWDGAFPEEVADEVVFADVLAEEIDPGRVFRGRCRGSGQGVEVGATEHVAFADDAGGDRDGVDGGVELRVRGREEEFFEEGAPGGAPGLLFARSECACGMGVAIEGWE